MGRRGYCSVADQGCKAPAGVRAGSGVARMSPGPLRQSECSECGQDVCTVCSTKEKGVVVCDHCIDYKIKKAKATE